MTTLRGWVFLWLIFIGIRLTYAQTIPPPPEGPVLRLTNDPAFDGRPAWSPDGSTIAFISNRGKHTILGDVWVVNPDGTNVRSLTDVPDFNEDGLATITWLGTTGDIVVLDTESLWEYFRVRLSATTNFPIVRTVADGDSPFFERLLLIPGGLGSDSFAVTSDGTTAWSILLTPFSTCPWSTQLRMAPLSSLNGDSATAIGNDLIDDSFACVANLAESFHGIAFSPDGSELVVAQNFDPNSPAYDLAIYRADGIFIRRLTFNGVGSNPVTNYAPSWSSDNRIAFASNVTGRFEIYTINPDGSNLTPVTSNGGDWPSWSPDSAAIAFQSTRDGNSEIYVIGSPTKEPPPEIVSISPSAAAQGTSNVILVAKGSNFQSTSTLLVGTPGISTIAYIQRTETEIDAIVSISATATPGPLDITVVNPDGQRSTLLGAFTVIAVSPPSQRDLGTQKLQQSVAEPVSTGTGNYYYQHTDFVVPGRGKPLRFERTYNTLDGYQGPLGANWTHSYNIALTGVSTSTVSVKWGDGHLEVFTSDGSAYFPEPGVYSTLSKSGDGSFILITKDQTRYSFSPTGKLLACTDRNGNATTLEYDGTGDLIQVTDPGGRALTFVYDSAGRILGITDPAGRSESYGYDSNNNLIDVTDAAGGITSFTYDANHHVLSIALANGKKLLQNTYDASGRVVAQANGLGRTWAFAYGTPNPTDTTVTDARENATIYTYDALLRIVGIKDALGGTISFVYDVNNNRTNVTNQNGNTTAFSYDAQGNITAIKDPNANVSAFAYDARNDVLTAIDTKGNTTNFGYDSNGNLTKIEDALGHTTVFAYDGLGEMISKKDAAGNTTAFGYDGFGNVTSVTDALGHMTNLAYDAIGRLTAVTDANGHTAHARHDTLSRLVSVTDALNHRTVFSYDPVGNLLTITDANGNATNYTYDAVNNLLTVTDALGHLTQYSYDENNNRTAFINAKGNATFYTYDFLNRLGTVTDPLAFVTAYSYDALGNVIAVKNATGNTNRFAYDALNRLNAISYGDGATVGYAYDAAGNRITMSDAHGMTTYYYDALNRLISLKNPDRKAVHYQYTALGNRQSVTYPDGKVVAYTYDPVGRLSAVQDWLGRITNYRYDPAGNLLALAYPNQAGISFTYDEANRLTRLVNSFRKASGKEDEAYHFGIFEYVLDAVGNRLQMSNGHGKTVCYSYDKLYELTGVTTERTGDDDDDRDDDGMVASYEYDSVGNRVRAILQDRVIRYSYDASDRLLRVGDAQYTFDANGNQTSVTKTEASSPITYGYDAANRLTSVTGRSINSSFSYDGDGNRISQSVGQDAFTYVNDVASALPVVLQQSGTHGDINFAYGLNLISESGSDFDNFYQYDGLGSVVGLTNLQGRLVQRYLYDAWGKMLRTRAQQAGVPNKFRFTAQELDPETSLYFFRARFYDPSLGRLLTHDPLSGFARAPLTKNKYVYALSNPLRFADPSGLSAAEGRANAVFNSGLPVQMVLSNSDSTLAMAPTMGEASLCAKIDCISGLSLAATGVDLVLHSRISQALVVPGVLFTTAKTFADPQLDVGHKLGRVGVESALAAAGLISGPVGVVVSLTVGASETFFPNQTNAAIDAGLDFLGTGFGDILQWTLGDPLPVSTAP